jgi:mRNA-degrading endonuclease RelE of RelBE toxin-antitoxin system
MSYTIHYSNKTSFKKELLAFKKSGLWSEFEKKRDTILKVRPLSGKPLQYELNGFFRVKLLKDWRIIYKVFAETKSVLIVSVSARSESYDDVQELLKRLDT